MLWLVLLVSLPLLLLAPGWWVQRVMRRYAEPADRYPLSGARLARELLDACHLHDVRVEATEQGDHYDPQARTVRLTPPHHDGRSLAAVTIAAHEVGHALQHAEGYRPLRWRGQLVGFASRAQRAAPLLLMAAPLLLMVTRVPGVALVAALLAVAAMALGTLVHLVTLPTEFDASFGRALPLLRQGGVLRDGDEPHARRLLTAAALTYVAAAAMSLLNLGRWLPLLRRAI